MLQEVPRNPLTQWGKSLPMVFWRGSTIGSENIDTNNLVEKPTCQLSNLCLAWPYHRNTSINRVAQLRNRLVHIEVEIRLRQVELLSVTVNEVRAALHAWRIKNTATYTNGAYCGC